MWQKKPALNISNRTGLSNALVPKLPPSSAVPEKPPLKVDDSHSPQGLRTGQVTLNGVTIIAPSRASRAGIKITNLSAIDIYIGSSNAVTVLSGDLLPAGRGQWIFLPTQSALWGIPASGTPVISFSEI